MEEVYNENSIINLDIIKAEKNEGNPIEFITDCNNLTCILCGKQFRKRSNLLQHERCHTGEKPFKCVICNKAFAQKSNLKRHIAGHRVWPNGLRSLSTKEGGPMKHDIYACQFCDKNFDKYCEFKKHMSDHSEEKVFRCLQENCLKQFSDVTQFFLHSNEHETVNFSQQIYNQPDGSSNLKCSVCSAEFRSLPSYQQHVIVENHAHQCTKCHAVFNTERYLRRHLLQHAPPKNCPVCKKPLRSRKAMREHEALHSGVQKYLCDPCGASFVSRFRLVRHMAKHFGKEYYCPYRQSYGCEKKFYRTDKLRAHTQTHQINSKSSARPNAVTEENCLQETHFEIIQICLNNKT